MAAGITHAGAALGVVVLGGVSEVFDPALSLTTFFLPHADSTTTSDIPKSANFFEKSRCPLGFENKLVTNAP